jgi:serine/threonine-protein kinase
MPDPAADRNLLFGILALQADLISRDALISAMNVWAAHKATPLGQILLNQGALETDGQALVEALVQKSLARHGGDAEKSLAALNLLGATRQELEQIGDADIHAGLDQVATTQCLEEGPAGSLPTKVGWPLRYRVLRPHARGGLGEVFVAHDEELHREVALKEIQPRHADHPDSRVRFLLEAEITGGLEHPGIVPVYGLGQYADGRPYYAMRFIKGDSLQDAIARFHQADVPGRDPGERSLMLRELLGRFVAVCNAVAYAHSRGVLHRDLKPANVMLGKYGETLVVDWGLAKVVGRAPGAAGAGEELLQPASDGSAPTEVGAALGTPAYMSPEQADGNWDAVGPASDVYSLGATLYCLLTGRVPFPQGEVGVVLRKVEEGDFPPPGQVKRGVPPALAAVCRKAMALRPPDRYATALALAADVEHWLADEPVGAYREPLAVRFGRWRRRHKALVAGVTAALLVVVLLGGAAGLWLREQAAEKRRDVAAALDRAIDLQKRERWGEAEAVLEQAQRRLGEGGPADLRRRVARARADLRLVGRLDAARLKASAQAGDHFDFAAAEKAYAAAFREWKLGRPGDEVAAVADRIRRSAVREQIVAALDGWAWMTAEEGRRAWLLAVARRADPDSPANRLRQPALAKQPAELERLVREVRLEALSPQLLAGLGRALLLRKGNAALPLLTAAQRRHPQDFWLNFDLGIALLDRKPWEAMAYYRAALALRPHTYAVHINLGYALYNQGRIDEAGAEYREAVRLEPGSAQAHYNLGNTLFRQGRVDQAMASYQKSLALEPRYAQALTGLGVALSRQGQKDRAIACYRKAVALDPKLAHAHIGLGAALLAQGQREQAIACFRKAVALDPNNAVAHCNLGLVLQQQARFAEALDALKRGHELRVRHPQWPHPSEQWLRACERLLALDARLPKLLRGEAQPSDVGERLEFASLCALKRLYRAAARFYQEAFAAQPSLVADCRRGRRYHAACAAARAAAGRGQDAAPLTEGERGRWRQQALDWLRADLALWAKQLDAGTPQARAQVRRQLGRWQRDLDLQDVRAAALARLPAAEQDAWRQLWAEVAALLRRAGDGK